MILGDSTYGWKSNPRLAVQPPRVMLHAEHLVIAHPKSGKELDLRAPLPEDFEVQLAQLRKIAKAAAKAKRLLATPPKRSGKTAPPPYHVHESRT